MLVPGFLETVSSEQRQCAQDALDSIISRDQYTGVADEIFRYTAGYIAVASEDDRMTAPRIMRNLGMERNTIRHVLWVLRDVQLVDNVRPSREERAVKPGKPPDFWEPRSLLPAVIATSKPWNAAAQICMVSYKREVSLLEAIGIAAGTQLMQDGLEIPLLQQ